MEVVRWAVSLLLLLLFVWVSVLNWRVFVRNRICRRPAPSWIPLLGGAFGVAGLLCIPPAWGRTWFWIPLLVDWGSVPGIVEAVLWHGWNNRHPS